jgi:hypothetical protein
MATNKYWQKYANTGSNESVNPNQSLLEYKDHHEFFNKFYELRTLAIFNLSKQQLEYDIRGMKELYVSVVTIIEWTSEYLNIEDIDTHIKEIDDLINKTSNVKEEKLNDFLEMLFTKIKTLWRIINKYHSKHELIPKVQEIEIEENPFKDEVDTAKRCMYSVVLKMFKNV